MLHIRSDTSLPLTVSPVTSDPASTPQLLCTPILTRVHEHLTKFACSFRKPLARKYTQVHFVQWQVVSDKQFLALAAKKARTETICKWLV
jgi:hypothetical protein